MDHLPTLKLRALGCTLLTALSVLASPAYAARWQDAYPDMRRIGTGELTWFGMHIYRAELWSPSGSFDPGQPYVLALTYERKVTAERQVDETLHQMEKQGVPAERQNRWRPLLQGLMVNVKEGDTMAGAYTPGNGAIFYYNGKLISKSSNIAFIKDFFGIWLDSGTTEPELRRKLLGAAQ